MAFFPPDLTQRTRIIDFKKINQCALANAPAVLQRIVPAGRIVGREYVVRNPKRPDHRPGSFKINVTNGRWCDFATGDKGGDIISLVAFLEDLRQSEAARLLAKMLDINVGGRHD